jgi:hypothetical protein
MTYDRHPLLRTFFQCTREIPAEDSCEVLRSECHCECHCAGKMRNHARMDESGRKNRKKLICWDRASYTKNASSYRCFFKSAKRLPASQPSSKPGPHSDRTPIVSNTSALVSLHVDCEVEIRNPFQVSRTFS